MISLIALQLRIESQSISEGVLRTVSRRAATDQDIKIIVNTTTPPGYNISCRRPEHPLWTGSCQLSRRERRLKDP